MVALPSSTTLMVTLFDRGMIGEGPMREILKNHSDVIFRPTFDDARSFGINPYALIGSTRPNIQFVDVDLWGDRLLRLHHNVKDGIMLEEADRDGDAAPYCAI